MKYIIIGLGSFGASLAQKLIALENEVIGVDRNMQKVEAFKEKISHTIQMDATDKFTVEGLPLKDTDVVIVAIGENQGDNIMATALLKNLGAKRLISRAVDHLHESVLQSIGVDEIVHPEEETTERWVKKLTYKNVVDSFELDDDYSVIETRVDQKYAGKTIGDINFKEKFNLLVLTIIKNSKVKSLLGISKTEQQVQGLIAPDIEMEENDILVLFGAKKDLKLFIKDKAQ